MNSLHNRCLAASAGMHSLLVLLLVAGSGFVAHSPDMVPMAILNFTPDILVAAPVVGGGNPNAPPQNPVRPTPVARPAESRQTPVAPPPAAEPVKRTRTEPTAPEPVSKPDSEDSVSETGTRKPTARKIEVNKVPVVRKTDASEKSNAAARRRAAEAAAEERARADARLQAENRRNQFGDSARRLQSSLSEPAVVGESFGPGGGGPTYAGYDLYVVSMYQRAFRQPYEAAEEAVTTRVRIVIARDGSVIESRIVSPSGVAALDRAVQAVLDRVKTIGEPLPTEIKGDRHSLIIRFNLKAKRLLG